MAQDDELVARRDLYRYVVSEVANDYVAIMDLFSARLLVDLSAAEVAEALATADVHLSSDDVETRCEQLLAWGNLIPTVRDTRVQTISDYLRARARYQPSKLGAIVHRQVADLMAEVTGIREVARELLGGMVGTLRAIVAAVSIEHADAEQLSGDVSRLFADQQLFTDSVLQFYGYLPSVLSRYDLAGEEYATFKGLLVDYVHLVSADVARHAPAIADLLTELAPHRDRLLELLAPTIALQNTDGSAAKRSPGRTASDWDDLIGYYCASGGRAMPAQLRSATDSALSQLLRNAKRMLAAAGTGVSRQGDLRRLAQWFSVAGEQDAHRIFDAVFGLYPARHLGMGPDEGDLVAPSTSWWEASPVDVPVSLRERGDRAARGRTTSVPDPGLEAIRLQDEAARESAARVAAAGEMRAARQMNGARLSPAARDMLLELLGDALGTGVAPSPEVPHGVHVDDELDLQLRMHADPDAVTVCTATDGTLRIDGLVIVVEAAHDLPGPDVVPLMHGAPR